MLKAYPQLIKDYATVIAFILVFSGIGFYLGVKKANSDGETAKNQAQDVANIRDQAKLLGKTNANFERYQICLSKSEKSLKNAKSESEKLHAAEEKGWCGHYAATLHKNLFEIMMHFYVPKDKLSKFLDKCTKAVEHGESKFDLAAIPYFKHYLEQLTPPLLKKAKRVDIDINRYLKDEE